MPSRRRQPPAGGSPDSLDRACGSSPGIACRLIWDITQSRHDAELTRAFFAGPVQLGLRIAFVVVLALIARFAARRLIKRITARATLRQDSGSERSRSILGERRQQRASALGSVLGNAASVTIFTIAIFIILLEDQYGVGDVIDIAAISGTVEAVSLRITRVRDVNGVIWHIRNGTITKSGNESHGWARAVIDFPVPGPRCPRPTRASRPAGATWATRPAGAIPEGATSRAKAQFRRRRARYGQRNVAWSAL